MWLVALYMPRHRKPSVPEAYCFWVFRLQWVCESVHPENLVNAISQKPMSFGHQCIWFIDMQIRFSGQRSMLQQEMTRKSRWIQCLCSSVCECLCVSRKRKMHRFRLTHGWHIFIYFVLFYFLRCTVQPIGYESFNKWFSYLHFISTVFVGLLSISFRYKRSF